MVAADWQATAASMADTIADPRAEHFYDVCKEGGRAIAESLGGSGMIAWDIYLFYPSDSLWTDGVPRPVEWAHQLNKTMFADPSRYYSGDALVTKLHEWMEKL